LSNLPKGIVAIATRANRIGHAELAAQHCSFTREILSHKGLIEVRYDR